MLLKIKKGTLKVIDPWLPVKHVDGANILNRKASLGNGVLALPDFKFGLFVKIKY